MKIFIIGINSFIGSCFAKYLKEQGIEIFGSSRALEPKEDLKPIVSSYFQLYLNQEFDTKLFYNIDVIIYCVHSHKDNVKLNIEGTKRWYYAAIKEGVNKHIFLTSYSAKANSLSEYALIKYELETFFLKEKQFVIRPGLVLGNGGLFLRMKKMIKSYPFLPLLDGGNHKVPIISIWGLCKALVNIIENPKSMIYNVFQEEMVTMKEFFKEIRLQLHSKCFFIPINSILPLFFLKSLEFFKIPFPIKSSSIIALKENQELSVKSSLDEIKVYDISLREIIQRLFEYR